MEIVKYEAQSDTQATLTKELADANNAYRQDGSSLMSDIEYDKKLEQLKMMEIANGFKYDISPTDKVGGELVKELKTVTHEFPALSLDKKKYKEREDLVKMFRNSDGHDDIVMSWKLDGGTVVATYDNGKLTLAATHGQDGITGNDITHNAVYFKGLPREIPYKDHLVVRGETLMTFEEFVRINSEIPEEEAYANPRNLATATVKMLDASESKEREIQFKAFELVYPQPVDDEDEMMYPIARREWADLRFQQDRFEFLKYLGFDVVEHERCNSENLLEKIEEWQKKIQKLPYPTDGLVFSYNDTVYGASLGSTQHHAKSSTAMKWTDETVPTIIRGVDWTVGKSLKISPTAVFDSVKLGLGSSVSRALLHNISVMQNMPTPDGKREPVRIGAKAEVYLANMIVPQIATIQNSFDGGLTCPTQPVQIPETCPVCGAPTEIRGDKVKVLYCTNKNCAAASIRKLLNTFGKNGLYAKGLGESQMTDLINAGLAGADALSFYELANEDRANSVYPKESEFAAKVSALWEKDGWGKKKWNNLISAIEASRKTTLQKFLYSLNIPLLGNDLSKKLSKHWNNDIEQFKSFVSQFVGLYPENCTHDDKACAEGTEEYAYRELASIDGVGSEKASNIIDWAEAITEMPERYRKFTALINELEFPEPETKSSDNSLEGLTFVITGAVHDYNNRDEFKASVEARGGKVSGSVSSKTSFLIANDKGSGTGKAAAAAAKGIPVLTEDEFIEKFGR